MQPCYEMAKVGLTKEWWPSEMKSQDVKKYTKEKGFMEIKLLRGR